MATQGITGFQDTVGATYETIFEIGTDFDGRNVYGLKLIAGVENVTVRVDGMLSMKDGTYGEITLASGESVELFTSGRANSGAIVGLQAKSSTGAGTLTWYPTVT